MLQLRERDTANLEESAERKGKPAAHAFARGRHAEIVFGHLGLNRTLLVPVSCSSSHGQAGTFTAYAHSAAFCGAVGSPAPFPWRPAGRWTLARLGLQRVSSRCRSWGLPACDAPGSPEAGDPGRGCSASAQPPAGRTPLPQRTSVFSAWAFLCLDPARPHYRGQVLSWAHWLKGQSHQKRPSQKHLDCCSIHDERTVAQPRSHVKFTWSRKSSARASRLGRGCTLHGRHPAVLIHTWRTSPGLEALA